MDFELDSKRIVDHFHNNKSRVPQFGAIIEDCRRLFSIMCKSCHVEFVKRKPNKVAHAFANMATSLASFYLFEISTCIRNIIINGML